MRNSPPLAWWEEDGRVSILAPQTVSEVSGTELLQWSLPPLHGFTAHNSLAAWSALARAAGCF